MSLRLPNDLTAFICIFNVPLKISSSLELLGVNLSTPQVSAHSEWGGVRLCFYLENEKKSTELRFSK